MNEPSPRGRGLSPHCSSFLTSQENKESWRSQVMLEKNLQSRNEDVKDKLWMLRLYNSYLPSNQVCHEKIYNIKHSGILVF